MGVIYRHVQEDPHFASKGPYGFGITGLEQAVALWESHRMWKPVRKLGDLLARGFLQRDPVTAQSFSEASKGFAESAASHAQTAQTFRELAGSHPDPEVRLSFLTAIDANEEAAQSGREAAQASWTAATFFDPSLKERSVGTDDISANITGRNPGENSGMGL